MAFAAGFIARPRWRRVSLTISGQLKNSYPMFPFLTTLERETTKMPRQVVYARHLFMNCVDGIRPLVTRMRSEGKPYLFTLWDEGKKRGGFQESA